MMGREELKLHAVAPGGPPEGQCEKEQEHKLVCDRTFDDPFGTLSEAIFCTRRTCGGRRGGDQSRWLTELPGVAPRCCVTSASTIG
jgi:hypothetical protein